MQFVTKDTIDYSDNDFIVFGSLITWEDAKGILEAAWFAEETTTEGLWVLKWNTDNAIDTAGFPIALKNLAPTTLTRL